MASPASARQKHRFSSTALQPAPTTKPSGSNRPGAKPQLCVRGERGPQFGAARCGLVVNGVGVQLFLCAVLFFGGVVVECGDEPVFEQLRFGDAQLERAVGVAGRVFPLHGSGVGEIGRQQCDCRATAIGAQCGRRRG